MPTSSTIKKKVFATEESVDHLRSDMNKGFSNIEDKLDASFAELMDIMVQSFHFVYARFDKIDARFEGIDKRIDLLESGMNVRFDSVNTRLDNVILDLPKATSGRLSSSY